MQSALLGLFILVGGPRWKSIVQGLVTSGQLTYAASALSSGGGSPSFLPK